MKKQLFKFLPFIVLLLHLDVVAQPLPYHEQLIRKKLNNGLTYNILPTKDKGKVYVKLVSKVGALVENKEERSMAHFLEHTLFNGSKNYPHRTSYYALAHQGLMLGEEVTAATSETATEYNINLPAGDKRTLKTALLILFDWTNNLTMDSVVIENEKSVIYEEIKRGGMSDGMRILAGTEHEGHTILGTPEEVAKITKQNLTQFYKKYYRPDMMTLIVAGDVDVALTEKLIGNIFGKMPAPKGELTLYNDLICPGDYVNKVDAKSTDLTLTFDLTVKVPQIEISTRQALKKKLSWALLGRYADRFLGDTKTFSEADISYLGENTMPLANMRFKVKKGADLNLVAQESLAYLAALQACSFGTATLNAVKKQQLDYYNRPKTESTLENQTYDIARAFRSGATYMNAATSLELQKHLIDEITAEDLKACVNELISSDKMLTYTDVGQPFDAEKYLAETKNPKGNIKFGYKGYAIIGLVLSDKMKVKTPPSPNLDTHTILSTQQIDENMKVYKLKNKLTVVTYNYESAQMKIAMYGNGGVGLLPKVQADKFSKIYRNLYSREVKIKRKITADAREFTAEFAKEEMENTLLSVYNFFEHAPFAKLTDLKSKISERDYTQFCDFSDKLNRSLKNSIVYIGGELPQNIDSLVAGYFGNITDSKFDVAVKTKIEETPNAVTESYSPWKRNVSIISYFFKKDIKAQHDIDRELILLGLERVMNDEIIRVLRDENGLVYATGATATLRNYPTPQMIMNCRYMIDPTGPIPFSQELINGYFKTLDEGHFTKKDTEKLRNILYKRYKMYYYNVGDIDKMLSDFYLKYGKIYSQNELIKRIKRIKREDVLHIIDKLIDMENYSVVKHWPENVPHK